MRGINFASDGEAIAAQLPNLTPCLAIDLRETILLRIALVGLLRDKTASAGR